MYNLQKQQQQSNQMICETTGLKAARRQSEDNGEDNGEWLVQLEYGRSFYD